jgi:hypothetical protein
MENSPLKCPSSSWVCNHETKLLHKTREALNKSSDNAMWSLPKVSRRRCNMNASTQCGVQTGGSFHARSINFLASATSRTTRGFELGRCDRHFNTNNSDVEANATATRSLGGAGIARVDAGPRARWLRAQAALSAPLGGATLHGTSSGGCCCFFKASRRNLDPVVPFGRPPPGRRFPSVSSRRASRCKEEEAQASSYKLSTKPAV